jgi:hypothetical protein
MINLLYSKEMSPCLYGTWSTDNQHFRSKHLKRYMYMY